MKLTYKVIWLILEILMVFIQLCINISLLPLLFRKGLYNKCVAWFLDKKLMAHNYISYYYMFYVI